MLVSFGFASADNGIILYGESMTGGYQKNPHFWLIKPCHNQESCERLTDPIANCNASKTSIQCHRGNTYYCGVNSAWHHINDGHNKHYLCMAKKPTKLPRKTIPDPNF